jgi:DNA-binding response OmpR family regulator
MFARTGVSHGILITERRYVCLIAWGPIMWKILVADDDRAMLTMVEQILAEEGYRVFTASTAEDALTLAELVQPDLFLIDLHLPVMNGLELCVRLRQNPLTTDRPIVFMTAQVEAFGVSQALGSGGDDYVQKPFAVKVLLARIRAQLRRISYTASNHQEQPAFLRIVPSTYQVFVDMREVMLTRMEFDLLNFLCINPQRWHTTEALLTNVWHYPEGVGDTALVRNHIRNLRRKVEDDPEHPAIIQSRHGRGYSIQAQVQFAKTLLAG